jgi:hypothetical protein
MDRAAESTTIEWSAEERAEVRQKGEAWGGGMVNGCISGHIILLFEDSMLNSFQNLGRMKIE